MIKKIIATLLFIPILGCFLIGDEKANKEKDSDFDIVWKTPVTGLSGNYSSVIEGNILYYVDQGLESLDYSCEVSAIDLNSGNKIWQNINIDHKIGSNIAINEEDIFVIDNPNEETREIGGIIVIDKKTGVKKGYIQPSNLFFDYDDKAVQIKEWWVAEHKGFLYFPVDSRDVNVMSGYYRISLDSINLNPSKKSYIKPELVLNITKKQRISTKPLFEGDRAYFYIGGAGPLYIENDYHLFENCYTQDVVRMVCIDLEGNIIWDRGFDYLGAVVGAGYNFKLDNNILYAADTSGVAAVNKNTGELLFEQSTDYDQGSFGVDYLTYSNGKIFYCMDNYLKCSDATSGKLLWEFNTGYTNMTNPIVFGDLVYNLDQSALRAFNIHTGNIVYQNEDLSISLRLPGYIPHKDNVIYIMDNYEIIALKMKE